MTFAGEFFSEVAIMLFNLKSVFVSTRRDSDKPEKVNISIHSDCCYMPPMNIV